MDSIKHTQIWDMVIFLNFKYLIWPNGLISWMNPCTGRKHAPALDSASALGVERGAQNPPCNALSTSNCLETPGLITYTVSYWLCSHHHTLQILRWLFSSLSGNCSMNIFTLLHTHSFLSKVCWHLGKRMFK